MGARLARCALSVGMAASGCTAAPTTADCDCLSADDDPFTLMDHSACGEVRCAVSASCPDAGEDTQCGTSSIVTVDETELDCALASLRDRKPGVVTWALDIGTGYAGRSGYVAILATGNAIVQSALLEDEASEVGPAMVGSPPSPEHFRNCLADERPTVRFECVEFDVGSPSLECE